MSRQRRAFVYGVTVGIGGLGVQAGNALRALARDGAEVHAIGPGMSPAWSAPGNIVWHVHGPSWTAALQYRPVRRYAGWGRHVEDRRMGAFARRCLDRVRPDLCYAFTQVALEPLEWASVHGIPGILESPNGHLREFRETYVTETERWCPTTQFVGHPSRAMVERVEREYSAATWIRVSSAWAMRSLTQAGVPGLKIHVLQQPVDLEHFAPRPSRTHGGGPLRVCFVGSLDLRKGFQYLLRAVRRAGQAVSLELVGSTGDSCCRVLLEREGRGLPVTVAPGDPRDALARCDVFVLPTLEDGSPFAVAEAMASAVPVITTTATGASEWIREGQSGWVVEPRSEEALCAALAEAARRRPDLGDMGRAGRADTERRVQGCDEAVSTWLASL